MVGIAVSAIVVAVSLDAIAASIIRSSGSSALGVPVDLEGVRVGITTPPTSVTGFSIGNPAGCERPQFLVAKSIEVTATVPELMGSDVKIPLVRIVGLTIDLEKLPGGKLNTDAIFGAGDSTTPDAAASAGSGSRRIRIAEVEIKDVTLRAGPGVAVIPIGAEFHLASLTLKNLDSKKSDLGVTAQLTRIIVTEVVEALIKRFGSDLAPSARDTLQSTVKSATQKLGDAAGGLVDSIFAPKGTDGDQGTQL